MSKLQRIPHDARMTVWQVRSIDGVSYLYANSEAEAREVAANFQFIQGRMYEVVPMTGLVAFMGKPQWDEYHRRIEAGEPLVQEGGDR